jgi:Rrf2 family transcriptional regulator, iron-sulfur cluster assembly transcription factor
MLRYLCFFHRNGGISLCVKMLHLKTSQNAVAAMSRLAELYETDQAGSSADIAQSRNLAQPLVAKILTALARAGLITGATGPGGGYRLAKHPREITLLDVVNVFEREASTACPFGPGWCGVGAPCPLHHSLKAMSQIEADFLKNTNFAVFCSNPEALRRTSSS